MFLVLASLQDLQAPLVHRVVQEAKAVHTLDDRTGQGRVCTWGGEREGDKRYR